MNASENKLAYELRIDKAELRSVSKTAGALYSSFDMRAFGSPKWRHIDEPNQRLAKIQRAILRRVLGKIELPKTMTGGIKGRSLLDHARPHCNKQMVVTLDLAHCFPSITSDRVYRLFARRLDYSPMLAGLLTQLTTFRRRLPQGTSTSPFLAALAMEGLHEEVAKFSLERGVTFTQFVDDMAFSGPFGTQNIIPAIIERIQKHGFAISRPKVRIMSAAEQQLVTGITVNKVPSLGREREDHLKERIASYESALFILENDLRSIEGTLAFADFISPRQAERLRRFATLMLPNDARATEVLRSTNTERRNCTKMKCQGRDAQPRQQDSLPNLGRRSVEGAPPSPTPQSRRRRGSSSARQLPLPLSGIAH